MENEDAQQLYVSDPIKNKDGIKEFTSYTLQGAKIVILYVANKALKRRVAVRLLPREEYMWMKVFC